MVRVIDVVAHLVDGFPAKTFFQSISDSLGEFAMLLLEGLENGLLLVEVLQPRHGVQQCAETALKI